MFTHEEKETLSRYVTNIDSDVFVLHNLPEVVKGALFSRYSRSPKSVKRLLLDEFLTSPDFAIPEPTPDTFVNTKRAQSFYDRVLLDFGDDSIAELASVHIAIENVSQMIGAKALEDNRIGISPLEKSTRYVRYDDKVEGKYKFYQDPRIQASPYVDQYETACNTLFETYANLLPQAMDWARQRYPRDETTKPRVYEDTIRSKACDLCRELLPLSTFTNVGLMGNGRSFEYLLLKMARSPYQEVQDIARNIKIELDKVIPSFIKRATNEQGLVTQQYLNERDVSVEDILQKYAPLFPRSTNSTRDVELLSFDHNATEAVLEAVVFERTQSSFGDTRELISRLNQEQQEELLAAYSQGRTNRHQKLGRPYELPEYAFQITADIGTYKDLQRHRMLTPLRQSFTNDLGYRVPEGIQEANLQSPYQDAMDQAGEIFESIQKDFPNESQYVLPLGYRTRWFLQMNLRELCHFTEIRSGIQGHPGYRYVAQQMSDRVREIHPLLAQYATQFVNYESVELERLEAEKRIDHKRSQQS